MRTGKTMPFCLACATLLVAAGLLAQVAGCAAEKKVPTRAEFEASVMGKTKDEIKALIGRPDRTSGRARDSWTYTSGVCRDPESGRRDEAVILFFDEAGRVESVSF